ncbi:hypothetical protein [Acinetobacter bouvetii]|uniref:Uncharacterized protein n=1 Tax=Acinetobacter bouvetii TaxID=202951 RepID=A0A811G9X8_9GAMM|nr:hypothetical protein [Acinetobacter bouvetii]CAB1210054.1 hypothetical protein SFB21_0729 [Acinetobacter bouvetii]
MSAVAKTSFKQFWTLLRNTVLIVLITAMFLCLPVAMLIVGVLTQAQFEQQSEFRRKLDYAYQWDHRQFPVLSKPVLIFSRNHSVWGGSVVLVYALDSKMKQYFDHKIQNLSLENTIDVECVKPTIKTRWRGWRLSLHYVQPNPEFLSHHDYANHDSFLVHGSTKYLPRVERACFEVFKRFPGIPAPSKYKKFEHGYWAVNEQEGLLFSVYFTDDR